MRIPHLSLSSLPGWARLNGIEFFDTAISSSDHGNGIVTTRVLSSVDTFDLPTLLEVPKDLILDREFLLEIEKIDPQYKQLRELITIARNNTIQCTVCHEKEVVCFGYEMNGLGTGTGKCHQCVLSGLSCVRSSIASQSEKDITAGVNNPWSEYVKFLPKMVPVPTMWNEQEIDILAGTSLEHVIQAKMSTLTREFEDLREKTIGIPWCHSCWWGLSGSFLSLELSDWIRLDAWYRSRCLELPNVGEVMIPCLDMANHSSTSNAYWEQTSNGDVSLILKLNLHLGQGSEITINYGDSKSDAENLFQYGFIDANTNTTSVVLTLEPRNMDPLRLAKLAAFRKPPFIHIYGHEDGQISWQGPFLYFICLNEDDGLEFKTLQEVDGEHNSLRVFWQGMDVTNFTDEFERLISGHQLEDVFKLRVATLLLGRIQRQLERLHHNRRALDNSLDVAGISTQTRHHAVKLREIEIDVLEVAYSTVNDEKLKLQESESVCQYLRLAQSSAEETPDVQETNEEDDFS
ncbi:hypothetical protein EYC80_011120 [Monilinia laxa]|uniref:SET domain-containing protein n=1 Tax=Monilinia laxa TaxID=61186 RepID=A0A5N6JRX0_MONLA|nr:hypothetical protein EYC80_011120 [Monilinia laxa]